MRFVRPVLLLAVAGVLFATAGASYPPCEQDHAYAARVDAPDGRTFYVVNEECTPIVGAGNCIVTVWVFEETNGRPGLQRGDACHDDTSACDCRSDDVVF